MSCCALPCFTEAATLRKYSISAPELALSGFRDGSPRNLLNSPRVKWRNSVPGPMPDFLQVSWGITYVSISLEAQHLRKHWPDFRCMGRRRSAIMRYPSRMTAWSRGLLFKWLNLNSLARSTFNRIG